MPNETLITEIENILSQIVALGGENERTAIVPNLIVQDANPAGLDGYVIVSDDRDGDNIPAKKVGSIVYSDNDLVNVMFLQGAEAIAFQQGSQSANSGIWEIVPSTSTDIFYDKGQVGVGTATPGEALDVAGNITLDADIIHRGDTDTKLSLTNDKVSIDVGGINMLALTETTQDLVEIGDVAGTGDVDINFNNDQMFLNGANGRLGVGTITPSGVGNFASDGNTNLYISSHNNAPAVTSRIIMQRSRGTAASPTAVQSGDFIFQLSLNAHNGTAYEGARRIMEAPATENWGVANGGFDMGFYTRDNGTVGAPTKRVAITHDGLVGINSVTSPSTELDIGDGAIEFEEMTAPGAGAANTARLYTEDDGSSNTQTKIIFNGGHITTIAKSGGLATYTPTNVVTDRSYDANATSVAELADVLGTLIADFQAAGILG